MSKKRGPSWEQTCDADVVRRPFPGFYSHISEPGRSSYLMDCPFCDFTNVVYIWSFAGGGKRCVGCGALAGGGGVYQFKHLINQSNPQEATI